MKKIVIIIIILNFILISLNAQDFVDKSLPRTPQVGHFKWITLDKGLYFARIPALVDKDTVEVASVVKIDPEFYAFRPSFDYDAKPISEWQEQLDSQVLINASYWEPDYTPTNHLVMDGKLFIGQFPIMQERLYQEYRNKHKGIFVAGALEDSLDEVGILGTNEISDFSNPRYETMVESWPMLIKDNQVVIKKDNWIANRTIVGLTEDNEVIFALTEIGDNLSLYETTNFLYKACNLTDALNLDGGIASEMAISTTNFNYIITGTYEVVHLQGEIRTKKGTQIPIPSVIGIYPTTN
ncbi:MAG: phosphodiester glycosidase family protein [Candidatus Celaenobacter antarcticus]|nr:phosphodiester glycosidase family protein [Candidatus Celaenobacter antarcticus]